MTYEWDLDMNSANANERNKLVEERDLQGQARIRCIG